MQCGTIGATTIRTSRLPVADVAADDAWLALWVPGPWLALGAHVPLIHAWGFKPSGIGFVWVKQNLEGYVRSPAGGSSVANGDLT
jgi:hypothetical protein